MCSDQDKLAAVKRLFALADRIANTAAYQSDAALRLSDQASELRTEAARLADELPAEMLTNGPLR